MVALSSNRRQLDFFFFTTKQQQTNKQQQKPPQNALNVFDSKTKQKIILQKTLIYGNGRFRKSVAASKLYKKTTTTFLFKK